ncbi:MAG: hypothetical protein E3J72_10820 [Planctomycetota bacterium]|nr:MAG: hypothetical protein E3J72_10820 [Planctomycetota bacterium]
MYDCPFKDEIAKDCPCVTLNPGCPRIGTCCDCIKFHRAMSEVPFCLHPVVEKIVNNARKDKSRESGRFRHTPESRRIGKVE